MSFRIFIQRDFESRQARNGSYSLRSYARDLGVSASRLSDVLNLKRGLSRKNAEKVAANLALSPGERAQFLDLVEAECSKSATIRSQAKKRVKERVLKTASVHHLQLDEYQTIAEWHHLGLLALLKTSHSDHSDRALAKQLSLTEFQVRQALERLARLGLIEKKDDGRWNSVKGFVMSPDGVPGEAMKKGHEGLLRRSIDALYLLPPKDRDFLSYLIPIRTRDLPEIRNRFRLFFQSIHEEFSTQPALDQVVFLGHQIVPMTPPKRKENP